ncbi:MAG: hypothetical protein LUQ25_06560 [Methanoregulaceae archaeon]|nr:hypothetical protein [Methanoregulaceae archaeon]
MENSIIAGVLVALTLMVLAGTAIADIPVNATPETKGITVATSVSAQGTVTASDSLTWQQSSDALNAPPLLPGGAAPVPEDFVEFPWILPTDRWFNAPEDIAEYGENAAGEVQYTAGYTESTMAVQGVTSYVKTTAVDTANKIADKNNIAANRIVTFIAANEQGRMTSSEDILVDGAGAITTSADKILCPFGTAAGPFFPPFCNVVMTGSKVDVSLASVSTSASERFVAATADVPVVQAYSISGKGVTSSEGSADAIGSMSAFMTAHLQDGRTLIISPEDLHDIAARPVKSEDISFSNSASASGIIKAFGQSYTYQSGIRRV